MSSRSEVQDGRDWAARVMGRTVEVRTPDQRRADIRREVEAEVDGWMRESRAKAERHEGAEQFRHATRHARAVTAPKDRRPDEPVGTERTAPDGTRWRRTA